MLPLHPAGIHFSFRYSTRHIPPTISHPTVHSTTRYPPLFALDHLGAWTILPVMRLIPCWISLACNSPYISIEVPFSLHSKDDRSGHTGFSITSSWHSSLHHLQLRLSPCGGSFCGLHRKRSIRLVKSVENRGYRGKRKWVRITIPQKKATLLSLTFVLSTINLDNIFPMIHSTSHWLQKNLDDVIFYSTQLFPLPAWWTP